MRISDWSSDVCSSDLDTDQVTSPRISPDGKHVAVSANLGEGNHAIVVYQVDDMQQTALLKLPRYEQPVNMYWASDTRLLVAKGRLIGSREKPLATGEIIATDFDGRNQLYVFGYRSEEHTSELQSLMRISYAVYCLKQKKKNNKQ